MDLQRITALLAQAEQAMAVDHLTYPAGGSALGLFDAVLAMDPENSDARRGLERIVERYIDMTEQALERGQLERARSLLALARVVDAQHPAIAPSERRLHLLNDARQSRLVIDASELRERSPRLVESLKTFGRRARAERCRATIRVGNDADGRWIYQNMSAGPDSPRIRAQVEIGSPPQVEVLCFPG